MDSTQLHEQPIHTKPDNQEHRPEPQIPPIPPPSPSPKARIIHSPHPFDRNGKSLFLAGSIAGNRAENWQATISTTLSTLPITILNPRRPDWDASWPEDVSFAPFAQQVEWELEMLEAADVVAMYFDPGTLSPVSLLELGLWARSGKMVVACPEGFWKRGNVQVVCGRFGIRLVGGLEELVGEVRRRFE